MSTLRHTLFFRFKDDVTEEQKQAMKDGLASLPGIMPFIRRYEFGEDLGLGDGNPDMALVADFDSEEDWRTYSDHPEHMKVVVENIRPIMSEVTRVQYLVD